MALIAAVTASGGRPRFRGGLEGVGVEIGRSETMGLQNRALGEEEGIGIGHGAIGNLDRDLLRRTLTLSWTRS